MIKVFTSFLLFFFCSAWVTAQLPQSLQDSLQATIQRYTEKTRTVGISAALHTSEHTWQGVAGISHQGTPLTSESLIGIGSITKTIVASCIMQMNEEGKIDIEKPLGTYIDSLEHIPGYIPIKHLLNHTSGLYDFTFDSELVSFISSNPDSYLTAEEVLATYMKEPIALPDEKYSYCNTNYVLLGMIIERVAEKKYFEEIKERFDFPNNYPSLKITPYEREVKDLTHLWLDIFNTGFPIDLPALGITVNSIFTTAAGAGAYSGQASDVAQWIYNLGRGDILGQQLTDRMLTIHEPSTFYGQGIEINDSLSCGTISYGHHGNIGYRSYAMYEKSKDVGISIHSNDGTTENLQKLTEDLHCVYANYDQYVSTEDLSSQSVNNVHIFPNPITDQYTLQLDLNKAEDINVYITDVMGRRVGHKHLGILEGGRHLVDMNNNHSSGIYFYHIVSKGFSITRKVIVQ